MRIAKCLVAAVLFIGGGCSSSSRPPKLDLGESSDLSGAGGDDLSSSSGDDMDTQPGDDGGGSCVQLAAWPATVNEASFNSQYGVTELFSADSASSPFDLLVLEDYHASGISYPKMVTYKPGDTYQACDVCLRMLETCSMQSCGKRYFIQGGTINLTQSDSDEVMGRMTATGSNLKLVEWVSPYDSDGGIAGDVPVPNGKCYEIASVTWDVPWPSTTSMDAGAQDLSPASDLKLSCAPVVNEIQSAGSAAMVPDGGTAATYEFVEIFNPCSASIDLTDWSLGYRSASNNSGGADTSLYKFTAGSIPAGGYLVIAGKSFAGVKDGILRSGLKDTGGAVGLRDSVGALVDSVSYLPSGSVTNKFTEGSPAAVPSAGSSIQRHPNGTDTNNNASDFNIATPTPRAANL